MAARVPQLDGDDKPFADASISRVRVSAWSPEQLSITLWQRRDASTIDLTGLFGKKQTEGFEGHPRAISIRLISGVWLRIQNKYTILQSVQLYVTTKHLEIWASTY